MNAFTTLTPKKLGSYDELQFLFDLQVNTNKLYLIEKVGTGAIKWNKVECSKTPVCSIPQVNRFIGSR